MRERITAFITAAVLLIAPLAVEAAPTDAAGLHDIGRLMEQAAASFDLEVEDAVVLLDSLQVSRLSSGAVERTVHTIVWFRTEAGLEHYADVHVPWNAETGAVVVHDLRTWRDERWWPAADSVSETAVVETTPGSVYNAYDYAVLREQALLHDGVELPCIVETRYTVKQERPPDLGVEGTRIAAAYDPTVRNAMLLMLAPGDICRFRSQNGASPVTETVVPGLETRGDHWVATSVARLGRPLVDDHATEGPALIWSTWKSWNDLAHAFLTPFDAAAILAGAPVDSIERRLEGVYGDEARTRAVVSYLDEATRAVGADDSAWRFDPRPAQRTWETAYGHAIDRAVLTVALLKAAGLDASPVWVGHRDTDLTGTPPGLSRFETLLIEARGEEFAATIDAMSGSVTPGEAALRGRSSWRPDTDDSPVYRTAPPGVLEIAVNLEPDGDGGFAGRGYIMGEGWLSPHDRVAGLGSRATSFLQRVAGSLLDGLAVDDHGLTTLVEDRVEAGFDVSFAPGDADDLGRTTVVLGTPSGGLLDGFAPATETAVPSRETPLCLPNEGVERITLRIEIGEREVLYAPQPLELQNSAGRFSLMVDRDDRSISVLRELELAGRFEPGQWNELRSLLLEASAPRSRTILLR